MKLYGGLLLLMCGALLLMSCASYQPEVAQDASALTSVEKQVVADGPSDKLALTKVGAERRDDEIVCKSEVKIGSKIPAREVCATRKQWSDRTKGPREQWKQELEQARYSS